MVIFVVILQKKKQFQCCIKNQIVEAKPATMMFTKNVRSCVRGHGVNLVAYAIFWFIGSLQTGTASVNKGNGNDIVPRGLNRKDIKVPTDLFSRKQHNP